MSWIKGLRDAVETKLGTMSLGAAISSDWVPEIQREKLTQRELRVFPASRSVKSAARGCTERTAKIGLMLADPMEGGKESDHAEAAQLLGDQLEPLLNQRIGGYSVLSIDQPIVLDHAEWREHRKLSTTFILTMQAIDSGV